MSKFHTFFILGTAALFSAGCAHFGGGATASGSILDSDDASKTVVLHVDNLNPSPMELRATVNGRTQYVGSVSGSDSTSILLDPSWFPVGSMYVLGISPDGRGRAVGGPLAAGKGDKIIFRIQPALDMSDAIVRR